MDLAAIRYEREKWMTWKNIKPLREALEELPDVACEVLLGDTVALVTGDEPDMQRITETAQMMKPWRKGPFEIFGLFIDTEWRSDKKYNLLRPHFNLQEKRVADIGCNNGYYLFRMQEDGPKKLVGFDPSALYKTQFDFINRYAKTDIVYELLGVEHLPYYEEKFDVIFCLGVLYHRSDPVGMLKDLAKGLEPGGEVFLDTFYIEGEEALCLSPAGSYSKIPNIYFVPTVPALRNWCVRAGFEGFEVLAKTVTTPDEQRKTEWIDGQSLEDFLDPADSTQTVEGYPASRRVYVKLTRSGA